jgi:hypothetical protein
VISPGRAELLDAIDNLARAAHGGDKRSIELRRLDARALAIILVRAPTRHPCPSCGVVCGTEERLAEHAYRLHEGPEPEHWREEVA